MLANLCDFFRGMFTRSFREAEETVTIEVAEGSSVAATVLVLEYIYTSTIEIHSNNVFEVLTAADKLQLTGLCKSCETYLADNLCKESVCSTWKASQLLGLSQLALKCKNLFLSEGNTVLESDAFGDLPKELALVVVADGDLNASEEVVFEAVVAWGEANKNGGSVRDAIADFMPHLRFVEMGHAFIQNRVRQSGLIPESILFDAVMRITDEMARRFQPGCKRAFPSEHKSEAATGPAKKRRKG
jgi:kelch-like protein 2/3